MRVRRRRLLAASLAGHQDDHLALVTDTERMD